MGLLKSLLVAIIIAFSLAGAQLAEAGDYISAYTTGKVTEYKAGKTIDVLNHEGDSYTYIISPDTDMPEKIEKGMLVEVTVADVMAVKIEVLSE